MGDSKSCCAVCKAVDWLCAILGAWNNLAVDARRELLSYSVFFGSAVRRRASEARRDAHNAHSMLISIGTYLTTKQPFVGSKK